MSVIVCGGILQSVSERREKEGRDGELKIKREKKRKKSQNVRNSTCSVID